MVKSSMKWWSEIMGYDRKKNSRREQEYVVKEGDTLESIATEFLDDPAAWPLILSYNGIGEEDIFPGRKIYFPGH